ncbi:MAG TPA: multiheme c-type cytochrome [Candidatus Eisenbacteria bacterium]
MVLVDNGGFFPELDSQQDIAWFLMDAMKVLGTQGVGVSERELRWGIAYLKYQAQRTRLPVLCANLLDAKTRRPALQPWVIQRAGSVKVGILGLISDKVDLGPSRDSLRAEEPSAAARRAVDELRKKGATVVVLLSQLGKVESEDLVAAVPGIDAVICGHNAPLIQTGRMIKNTVTSYGGEQGQYVSRTLLTIDARRRATTGENECFMLGPEVGERPEVAKLVKDFEDALNEKLRKAEKERAAAAAANVEADHFLGAELCARCHAAEAGQWKTTSHSVAWQTLVEVKKDATPDCIPCHVVGYKQAGGFQSSADATRLGNVQCENCHGMGTQHEAFATAPRRVTEQTCTTCHHGENDPEFDWAKKLPMIAHDNLSGATLGKKKVRVPALMKTGMKTGSN